MSHHTIGKLVKHKTQIGDDTNNIGIVINERLKETFDENGYGGCYVPQVLVAWKGLDELRWIARKRLKFSYEDQNGESKFI